MSRTNIELDDNLVAEAMRLTKARTKKAIVNLALEELVKRKRRRALLKFEGKVEWEGSLTESRKSRA